MSKLENAVPGYKYLIVEPYTPNIGAVIHDFDLSNIGDESTRAELRKALVEFQVLFFRRQQLSPEQQIAVARVFGDPDKAKAFFPRHETQNLIEVLETRPAGHRYGTDQWHADITFSANPPTGTVLYSHVIPPAGGDTLLWRRVAESITPLKRRKPAPVFPPPAAGPPPASEPSRRARGPVPRPIGPPPSHSSTLCLSVYA